MNWIDRRRAGLLLHISSLPGPFPCGVLGSEAREFVDVLADAGFSVWQFLPLGPTHGTHSPYESASSFAGNPRFLDLRPFVERGWLDDSDLADHDAARARAAENCWRDISDHPELQDAMDRFRASEAGWLEDYALFQALKEHFGGRPWWRWPAALRDRQPEALQQAAREHEQRIRQTVFEQFWFARQWDELKRYAESRQVLLFGDLPIYAAHDSADVWSHRELFTLDDKGRCTEVAGVPPDYFSKSGQRWGNPLYRWDRHVEEDFAWWTSRVQAQMSRMHILRIDHFRGLEAYWAIPADRRDGRIGEWRKAPGDALLQTLRQRLGRLPLVAEDLGLITPEVKALLARFNLPGMKVLQFAFDGMPDNPYLPEHIGENSVVYTGTHDNDTTLGWFQSLDADTRARVMARVGGNETDMPWPLIRLALETRALLAVIPAQDVLALGSEARFNTPGVARGNWQWRLRDFGGLAAAAGRAREMIQQSGR